MSSNSSGIGDAGEVKGETLGETTRVDMGWQKDKNKIKTENKYEVTVVLQLPQHSSKEL
jgi:hypothetical protein